MSRFSRLSAPLLLPVFSLSAYAGCSSSTPDAVVDAGVDSNVIVDTGTEDGSTEDVAVDTAVDPVPDASLDAPVDAAPKGNALRFDGVNDMISFTTAAGNVSETAFSSELWFRSTTMTGMLLEVFGAGADRSIYLKDGKLCFYVYTPGFSYACSTANFNDGSWHHVAATLGAVGGQNLYVDGVLQSTQAATKASAFTSDSTVRAGYGYIGAVGVLTYFAGDLDEIRVWNVERTATEIASNRATTINPATAGLQYYWKLDETGTSTTTADSKGGAYTGTLTGFSTAPSPWIPGAL
ncbi:MAG: LamG domain-containing protein [Polyangiaceae bacterium]|nr:LamG domain-containing protein [Polyangiaceae bacterium]